jgi:hypothetical protein
MSIVDEQDLSERLSGVLDAITPSPPPVSATLRSGKLIRVRRNIAITAGLAVAAGLVVAAPGFLRQPAPPGGSSARPMVMIRQVCPSEAHGGRETAHRPGAGLVVPRAGGLPAAEFVTRGCAWLGP